MASLSLSLLGPFQVLLDGEILDTFAYNKVGALLAYLAAENKRPQRREVLADLLWPDWPQKSAMRNLSYALANLCKSIGDRESKSPILIVSRDSLQMDREGDVWVDIWEFDQKARDSQADLDQLKSAVELYRGAFLEGFSLSDSAPFEEWLATQREIVQRQMLKLLYELVEVYTKHGEYEQALLYARRQLALEAWHEPAHRQLMHLLAQQGQRVEALAQFERLRRTLQKELGAEPSPDTYQLYDQIRQSSFSPSPEHMPAFLSSKTTRLDIQILFVARQSELERLHAALDQAIQGNGGIMLVTGGPGRGKSMLLGEFLRQAVTHHPHLLAASGNYQAYFGRADPYLPFREILAMLTGNVEARWMAGTINLELAHRLWDAVPHTVRALVESGPALIETMVPGGTLINCAG